jgi:hypothetical protein
MEESSRTVKTYEMQLAVRVSITVVWVLIQSSAKMSKLVCYSEMLTLKGNSAWLHSQAAII